MTVGLATATLAVAILFIEIFEFATSSEWPGLTLADGLSLFGLVHEQVEDEAQRLRDVLMAVPLSLVLFLTGVSSFFFGTSLGDWRIERRLAKECEESDPLYSVALLAASDVSWPTKVRLFFLDSLLRIIAGVGALLIIADGLLLLLLGAPIGWLAAAGLGLLLMVWLTHRAERRKLDESGATLGTEANGSGQDR